MIITTTPDFTLVKLLVRRGVKYRPGGVDKLEYTYIPVITELCDPCGKRVAASGELSCVQHCKTDVTRLG